MKEKRKINIFHSLSGGMDHRNRSKTMKHQAFKLLLLQSSINIVSACIPWNDDFSREEE